MNKKQAIKSLEDAKFIVENQIKDLEEGTKIKGGIFKKDRIVVDEAKVASKKTTLKALDIALDRLEGKKIVRPKDPITNQTTEPGAKDTNTTEETVTTQEGAELTPQQINDQRDSASISQDKLGRLDEYADKVDKMDADTADLGEIKAEDIEAENEAMMLELEDPEIIESLPDVAKQTLQKAKKAMKEADDAAEKARVSYDNATKVGAQCVIRSKS